ncbi:cell cycle and apoptosis regulator protein 2 isoform X2 [Pygocentrus nattereri]|uniref:Cell cycle and apoptosis regulator 2 n=1 Tax=Pygocentrus nattereri TaxID=42514 RepID=A0AAR2L3Z2_PYGNA|nr:cell cycle and apoptosis regulator protein 2 isoform X2 [Pygocentrus nattereri]
MMRRSRAAESVRRATAQSCSNRVVAAPRRRHGSPPQCQSSGRRRRQNATHKSEMRQRVFTGVVTQLQDHHGIVDQEVRFPISVVVGRVPLVGEKVLVKAVQDPLQPVNWTAQRVQALNGQPFKSPPPLLPSMSANMKPGILGNKPQPLLKSPKIPPLIPTMQPNPGGMHPMPHHQQMPWGGPFDGWGGSRKRHSEPVGGRRGGRWEEGGSSWGSDSVHQKRRRWRVMPEEEAPKKSTPVASQCIPLFSCFPRDSQALDSLELQRRYPHLHAPASLFHVQLCWPESFPPSQPLPLAGPCFFHVGASQAKIDVSESMDSTDTSFSVKVMLLSMPDIEDLYSQCCSCLEGGQANGDIVHPTTLFKFLLLEKAGELQLPGGPWSPKVDGSNPAKDSSVLIRTAVRCVKEQTALDLTACTQWHKMAELRVLAGNKTETVVILLPDVWNLVPTAEEWAKSRNEQRDDESPLPEAASLVVQPSAGLTLSTVSLSSLLERTKDTFEVCLVGELFSEMLQRDFGLQLYHSLSSLPPSPGFPLSKAKTEDNSTALEEEPKKTDKQVKKKGANDSKKKRTKEEGMEEEETVTKDEQDQHEKQPDDQKESKNQAVGEEELTSGTSDNQSLKDNDQSVGQCVELPRRVLLSWVFFDRQLTGHLKEQDLQNILLSLGLYLNTAQAQDLVRKASVGGQCLYRKLCSRWTDPEEVAYDLSAEGNKSLLPGLPTKERGSSRRSSSSVNSDVVTYKGTVVNIPNLLQALESSKAAQQELEKRIASLQATLEAAEAKQESDQQEQLKSSLEKAEMLNKAYEKSLKENAGHMLDVIEKMQKMVDQTTILTRTKETKGTKD